MVRLVIDSATMRVVFFTTDLTKQLTISDDVLLYDLYTALPPTMTLDNCWNWKLKGNILENPDSNKKTTSNTNLFVHNQQEAINLLIKSIDKVKKSIEFFDPISALLVINDQSFLNDLAKVKNISPDEYLEIQKKSITFYKNAELNKEYFLRQIKGAKSNDEILRIRDIFSNVSLKELYTGE